MGISVFVDCLYCLESSLHIEVAKSSKVNFEEVFGMLQSSVEANYSRRQLLLNVYTAITAKCTIKYCNMIVSVKLLI